ncbi:Nudix hydrolase 14-like protein [Lachnellula arida]|uniref:Nudix hydrolase 14-like protein n=1 Tax=Lachnellula arida TaxID=1316785 RepID=A0A8T9BCT0_9HELO|nr:Nudix hydrolase 14-like protein [Lachnellula arida]
MSMTSSDLSGYSNLIRIPSTLDITTGELFQFRAFRDWLNTLKISLGLQEQADHPFRDAPYALRSITIQSVDRFGPTRIGFVKLVADIRNKDNETLPGIVFEVVADSKDERWVVMTEQPRIPAGSLSFKEIPAGMLDDNGDMAAAAAEELFEETKFKIPSAELEDLTALTLNKTGVSDHLRPAMYPSPGGSDEFISIFLWEKVLDRREIEAKKGKYTGLRDHGEKIVLRIINYDDFFAVAVKDGKTLGAWALYEKYMKDKQSVHA